MSAPWTLPAGVELGAASAGGEAGARLMVILRAPGCVFARRTGGCTNCGFWQHLTSDGDPVSTDDYLAQLAQAMKLNEEALPLVRQLDIFCSGSFLCDGEVPPEAREPLLALAARELPGLRAVMIESRPEYITPEAISPLVAALPGPVLLEVGMGLESADAVIREQRIKKGFTLEDFAAAARVLADAGAGLAVYLLLKPLGTGDEEAVEDVLASGRYLAGLAHDLSVPLRIALEPTFVPEQTPLYDEMKQGRYTPPSLWDVIHVTRQLASLGLPIHVGLSSEGLPAEQVPSGCPRCTHNLRTALAAFNETQACSALQGLRCPCQAA